MLPFGFERRERSILFYLKRPDYLQPWNFFKGIQWILERLNSRWWTYLNLRRCATLSTRMVIIHGLDEYDYEIKFTRKTKKR